MDDGNVLTAKQVKELQKRNAQLRRGKPHLNKSDCHLHATHQQRLTAVHNLRFLHDIKTLCRVLNVNRSTYYKHFHSSPTPRTAENQQLRQLILHIYADYDKRLGAYKTRSILERDYGIRISVGRVYRLMRDMALPKMSTSKPRRHKRQEENRDCSNHLKQQFSQHSPNLVWVSDFTYIKAGGRWYYLCVMIDLFSRKVIAGHISAKPDVELVMTTFKKAYKARNTPYGLMFHSDRGSQYTAFAFRQLLDSLHVVQSFSKKGYPFDNAVCESFFRYLKKEETDRRTYTALTDLKISVFSYIEGYYNSKRPHSSLDYLTPDEMESAYWGQK